MLINTKANPSPKVYAKQFQELLEIDKLSYGIVSSSRPDRSGSPLWVDTMSIKASLFLSSLPRYYAYMSRQDESVYGSEIRVSSSTGEYITAGTGEAEEGYYHFDFVYTKSAEFSRDYIANGIPTQVDLGAGDVVDVSATADGEPLLLVGSAQQVTSPGLWYCDVVEGKLWYCAESGASVEIKFKSMLGDKDATTASVNAAFMQASDDGTGIKSSLYNGVISIVGVADFGISSSSTPYLSIEASSRVVVSPGKCVMPKTHNIVSIEKDCVLNVPVNGVNGKILFIVLREGYEAEETGTDVFGKECVKTIKVSDGSRNLEIVESFGENENCVCLGVIRPYTPNIAEAKSGAASSVIKIDSKSEDYEGVRPWYSITDSDHAAELGTGKVTDNNPHGIAYNDLYAKGDTTLHNALTDRGMLLSKPTEVVDVCGVKKSVSITKLEVMIDESGAITGKVSANAFYGRYYELPDLPLSVISIKDTSGNDLAYRWVPNTTYIEVPHGVKLSDFTAEYFYEPSLSPVVGDNGSDVDINGVGDNCVLFSEGRSLELTETNVSFKRAVPNKEYCVYVNGEGNLVKTPTLAANVELVESSGTLDNPSTRSRLEVVLDDIPGTSPIHCPTSPVLISGSTNEAIEVYQSFAVVKQNKYGTKYYSKESSISKASIKPPVLEDSDNRMIIECEKSTQLEVDTYTYSVKPNVELGTMGYGYNTDYGKVNLHEGDVILGGIDVYVALSGVPDNSRGTIRLTQEDWSSGSREYIEADLLTTDDSGTLKLDENEFSGKFKVKLHTDAFDGKLSTGVWRVSVGSLTWSTRKSIVDEIKIVFNYGKIEPRLYAKLEDGTYRTLPHVLLDTGRYEVDLDTGSPATPINYDEFMTKITLVGHANGEEVTEEMEFGSDFRNQSGMNSKMSENTFDSIDKFNITETSSSGSVTMLAHPVGNVDNMCALFSAFYGESRLNKIVDRRCIRVCVPDRDRSIMYEGADFTAKLTSFCEDNRLRPYFSLENVCDEPVIVTIRTGTLATAYTNNETTTTSVSSGSAGTEFTLLPGEHIRLDGSTPIGEPGVPLVDVSGSSSARVAVRHYDTTWTSLRYAFCDCDELVSIPDSWEGLENVTDMTGAFSECRNLKTIPSSWEGLEKVTTFDNTFYDCISLESIPATWEGLDSLEDLNWTFVNAGITQISSWKGLDSLRVICSTFAGCHSLESIPATWEGLERVHFFGGAFSYCSSLKAIPDYWSGLSSVESATIAFCDCTSLTNLPISWAGLEKVSEGRGMFSGCTGIREIPKSWKGLQKLTNAAEMFKNCSGLTEGGSRDIVTLSNVTDVKEMLYGCTSITESVAQLYEFFSTTKDSGVSDHRNFCSFDESAPGWNGIPVEWGGGDLGDGENYVVLENTADESMTITIWSRSNCVIYKNSEAFSDIEAGGAVDVTLDPGDIITAWDLLCCGDTGRPLVAWVSGAASGLALRKWNTSETNLSNAFYGCSCLSSIPDSWEGCHNVTSMNSTFKECTGLSAIPGSWAGLEKVSNMDRMFEGCQSLKYIPERWDGLACVTSMNYMFYYSGITGIPKSFNGLSSITCVKHVFESCLSLSEMNGSWEGLESCTDMEGLFKGCSAIRTGGGTSITSLSAIKNCTDAFSGCSKWTGSSAYNMYILFSKPNGSGTSTRASSHANCFFECSSVENYENIPGDWGGNYPSENEKFMIITAKSNTGTFNVYSSSSGLKAYVDGVSKQGSADGSNYKIALTLSKGQSANIYGVNTSGITTLLSGGNDGSLIIARWPDTITDASQLLYGCKSLGAVTSWEGLENVVSLEQTFENCSNLTSVSWDFSTMGKLTTINKAFKECSKLSFSISNWGGMGNIEDMGQAFEGTGIGSFPQSWNGMTSVTNLFRTFANCKSLRTGGCYGMEELPSGVDMRGMLYGCSAYVENTFIMSARMKELNLDASGCFSGCISADGYGLTPSEYGGFGTKYLEVVNCSGKNGFMRVCSGRAAQIHVNGVEVITTEPQGTSGKHSRLFNIYKDNTIQITSLDCNRSVKACVEMYTDSTKKTVLRGLEISKWDSTITSYEYAFDSCESLTKVRSWEGLDNVTEMDYTFFRCKNLTSLPSEWNMPSLKGMDYMFYECSKLESIPDSWEGLGDVESISGAFGECTKLQKIPDSWEGLENVYRSAEMFEECTSLSGGITGGSSFGHKGEFYDCHKMFYGCRSYNVDVGLATRLDEMLKAKFSDYEKGKQKEKHHNRVFGAFYKINNESAINATGLFDKTWFSAT